MPICNFFLQNRCRFGENCKFEHPRGGAGAQRNLFGGGGGGGGGGQRLTFRDSFGTAGNQGGNPGNNQFKWNSGQQTQGGQSGSQTTAMDMVNGLPKDIDAWEQTKMWPFSCLSVEKELPCLPGFHDISIEEIRLEAYQAQKAGTMQAFTQKLQGIAHEYQTKRNQLRNMSMEVKQKLASFIDDARKKKATNAQSMTGTTASVFGSATAPQTGQGLFGKTAASSSTGLFGQSSTPTGASTFGSNASGSGGLFGKPAAQSSPFGSTNTTFGNTNSSNSLFGTPQRSNLPATGGLFGSQTQTPQAGGGSVFGQLSTTPNQPGAGLFGQQPQTTPSQGLFGNSSTAASPGLFGKPSTVGGGQPQNSVFGALGNNSNASNTTSAGTGLFGKPAGGGMAGGGAGGGSIFGQQPSSTVPSGLFGAAGQTQSGAGGGLFGALNNNNNQPSSGATAGVGLFGKPAIPGGVGAAPSGLFGQTTQLQQPASAGGSGLFAPPNATANTTATGTGLFGKGPQMGGNTMATQGSGGLFGKSSFINSNSPLTAGGGVGMGGLGSALPTSVIGNNVSSNNSNHFSVMDELSPQDIEAFKASAFVLGKIPIKPPPRELVMI